MASEDGKPEELRIVLFGDSGSGKSATGNTILGKRAFTTRTFWFPTLTYQMERGEFEGTPVSVVETPWRITHNTTEKSKYMPYCVTGPHAFLLVMPLKRFNNVERQMKRYVKSLQRTFGDEALRHTIVLFTCGDKFPNGVTPEEFIHQNPLPGAGDSCLLPQAYHVFNNRSEDPSQVRELLQKINSMVQRNGGGYCIEVKDWKQYLYPFASAVTIGGGIAAASGGTAEGVLVAFLGSAIGAVAGGRGNRLLAAAVLVAVVVAVACACGPYIVVAVSVAVPDHATVAIFAATPVVCLALGVLVGISLYVVTSEVGFAAAAVSAYAAGVALLSAAIAVTVSLVAVDAAVGPADAIGAGAVIGAGIAAKIASGIFTGAGTAGAAFDVFDDIGLRAEAIQGIIGGAGVGAGVSAAVIAYADNDTLNAVGAFFTAVLGLICFLPALFVIVHKTSRRISKTAGLTIAGVSAGAAFGAAAGVVAASHFASHFAGVIITIVCKAVAMGLNRSS